jgi:hypothetical protein
LGDFLLTSGSTSAIGPTVFDCLAGEIPDQPKDLPYAEAQGLDS